MKTITWIIALVLLVSTVSASEIIERTATTDLYFDGSAYNLISYGGVVNMLDSNGVYRPYEEVTSFSSDKDKLTLEWNNKKVILYFYTKSEGQKERFDTPASLLSSDLNFKTSISKLRGRYYYNHTLNKNKQPEVLGYDIETENVFCNVKNYSLICDEQRIDFSKAVEKQNLTVFLTKDSIEFQRGDLSYIDPNVQITANQWGEIEKNLSSGAYEYFSGWLWRIGDRDYQDGYTNRGWTIFDVSSINDEATIVNIQFTVWFDSVAPNDCSVYNMDFYQLKDELYDMTPDTEAEEQSVYNAIGADTYYTGIFISTSNHTMTHTVSLSPNADSRLKDVLDDYPSSYFTVAMKGDPDEYDTDCFGTLADDFSSNLKLNVTYMIPTASGVKVLPETPTVGNNLICNFTYSGPYNLEEKNSTYEWWKNSLNQNINSQFLGKENLTVSDQWYCKVIPSEGLTYGDKVQSNNTVTIATTVQSLKMYVNTSQSWIQNGYYSDSGFIYGFEDELQNAIDNCNEDAQGYCNISIIFSSDSTGVLNLSNLEIFYKEAKQPVGDTFNISNAGSSIAIFDSAGNLFLKNTLIQSSNPLDTADDEFLLRDDSNVVVTKINSTGYMEIKGTLQQNQGTLTDPTGDDFLIKEDDGTVVAYINESGFMFLKGSLYENYG